METKNEIVECLLNEQATKSHEARVPDRICLQYKIKSCVVKERKPKIGLSLLKFGHLCSLEIAKNAHILLEQIITKPALCARYFKVAWNATRAAADKAIKTKCIYTNN